MCFAFLFSVTECDQGRCIPVITLSHPRFGVYAWPKCEK